MPVTIRSLGLGLCAARYYFSRDEADTETHPWIYSTIEDDESLCEACIRLNISWLFENFLYEYTVKHGALTATLSDGIRLGRWPSINQRTSCRFCQFVVHALNYWSDYDAIDDSDEWQNKDVYLMNVAFNDSGLGLTPRSKKGEYAMRLSLTLRSPEDETTISKFGDRNALVQKLGGEQALLFEGRKVAENPRQLVDRVASWIRPCLQAMPPSERSSLDGVLPLALRLIDTQKRCIVGPFTDHQYVALSYTWGKIKPLMLMQSNEKLLREEVALKRYEDQIPTTIQDAISLCSMLGFQYLWIDSLCIVQDGPDKQFQIQQMDRIYIEAIFTIVAAAGKDANAGLPGVCRTRFTGQRIFNVGEMNIANTLPECGTSLGASEWNWRGWTFQEGLLSTRKLVFTVDQAYYHCPHGDCSEDKHNDIHRHPEPARQDDFRLGISNVPNWTVYTGVVSTYCRRELSYESDALNAFAGMESYLSKSLFASSPFVTGIPLYSLEMGLLWQPLGPLRRRLDPESQQPLFPSWSWVAWWGHLDYGDGYTVGNLFERCISRVKILNLPDDEHMTCKPPPTWNGWSKWTRKVVEGDYEDSEYRIYYLHENHPQDRWFAHPVAVPPATSLQTNLTWPQLEIEVDVSTLKLTGEHADLWYRSEECDEGVHEICRLQVFDEHDSKAGTVVMDGATFNETDFSDSHFSFIKMAQTTLTAGRDDPAWDEESKTFGGRPGEAGLREYRLMAGDEAEFDQEVYDRSICWCLYDVLVVKIRENVAERIAVGKVHIHALDNPGMKRTKLVLR